MEEILYRYNPWWEEGYTLPDIVSRPSIIGLMKGHLASRHIVFLTGLRRVGKTTLLRLFIKHLLGREGINKRYIFYISLDDYLLAKRTILEIVEEYRKIHRIPFSEKIFLFLDEITYQENYEVQLKNLYDSQNTKIYASSSSASILRSKKPYLTGRSTVIEVLPLNFEEFLEFKKIRIGKSDSHLLEGYFEDYLSIGGLPEYVLRGDIEYLKELVDDIIYKDIAAFYNIRATHILKDFFLLLMERAGKSVS
ncbi:MAG: ATP-binding protein, partial [Nitrospirae bacterium]|nr:ATP-binding protein [Nitrospirota bacterium]